MTHLIARLLEILMDKIHGKNLVLLVEDKETDAELTIACLRKNNFTNPVVTLRDGMEALDYLYRRNKYSDRTLSRPALILLDLNLPKMGGIEVVRRIKQDKELKHIPVIILTVSERDADLIKCYALGVSAYVVKPVEFDQFVEAVKSIGLYALLDN